MPPTYERKDHYYKKAKKEGLASRAVYKLEEIDRQFHLLKSNARVLDLGCAPGGWLQYTAKKIGPGGIAVGVDLLEVKASFQTNIQIIRGDATQSQIQKKCFDLLGEKADLIVSDMSPNLSGIRFKDHYESYRLGLAVLETARELLKREGSLVVKIFPGDDLVQFKDQLKENFSEIKTFVPKATRKGSSEIYLIAKRFKG